MSYPNLTRRQKADGVLSQLRALGPQTVAQIQSDLKMTKREVEDALWLLGNSGAVEYAYPLTSPLTYEAHR